MSANHNISHRTVTVRLSDEERHLELLREAATSSGVNPRGFILVLSRVIERRMWETFPGGSITFHEFIERVGLTPDALESILEIPAELEDRSGEHERFEETREEARKLLGIQRKVRELLTPEVNQHGTNQHAEGGSIRTSSRGTTENYTMRVLHRDHPKLYRRVLDGELSAHAAAIEARIRKPTATVPVDSAEKAIKALSRRFTIEELREALDHLSTSRQS
jgi:hypothetical protein